MINSMQDYGRVAVLIGGLSGEREVSLQGGTAVFLALQQLGVSAQLVDVKDGAPNLEGIDRAFIMVHGEGGEDGRIQGYLETLNIPYTGSGIQASAVCMHKYISKVLWDKQGLCTPEFVLMKAGEDILDKQTIQYPVVVKPCTEGSSIGMSIVSTKKELPDALKLAFKYDDEVLVERWVAGNELTVSIVGDTIFPVIEVETDREFYDYKAKYEAEDTRYIFPEYTKDEIEYIQSYSLDAFKALGAKGWGRVDLMRDKNRKLWLLEVNTVPGMTDHSLVPKAAKMQGLEYNDLVQKILAESL